MARPRSLGSVTSNRACIRDTYRSDNIECASARDAVSNTVTLAVRAWARQESGYEIPPVVHSTVPAHCTPIGEYGQSDRRDQHKNESAHPGTNLPGTLIVSLRASDLLSQVGSRLAARALYSRNSAKIFDTFEDSSAVAGTLRSVPSALCGRLMGDGTGIVLFRT